MNVDDSKKEDKELKKKAPKKKAPAFKKPVDFKDVEVLAKSILLSKGIHHDEWIYEKYKTIIHDFSMENQKAILEAVEGGE